MNDQAAAPPQTCVNPPVSTADPKLEVEHAAVALAINDSGGESRVNKVSKEKVFTTVGLGEI